MSESYRVTLQALDGQFLVMQVFSTPEVVTSFQGIPPGLYEAIAYLFNDETGEPVSSIQNVSFQVRTGETTDIAVACKELPPIHDIRQVAVWVSEIRQ